MKIKFLFFLFLLSVSLSTYAQRRSQGTFAIGAAGQFKSTWLLNKNIADAGDTSQNYTASWGQSYGLTFSSYFTDYIAIEMDILYAQHTQKYHGSPAIGSFNSQTTLTSIDIPFLLFIKAETGSYLEIGCQYSFINKADFSYDGKVIDYTSNVSKDFLRSNLSGLLGVGMEASAGDQWQFVIGFRFLYGFSDLKGVDAYGVKTENAFKSYKPTHSASGAIHLGVKYLLDY